jgi:6-phosphogluconolactonase (cycloisomerase 2 family)
VTGPGGAVIPVKMNINVTTTQVVLTPASPLPSGSITVNVKNVADLAGVVLAAPYIWSFSTSCGATYFYVGVESPNAAIRGYQVNVDTASLTDVPGSPFAHAGSGPGLVMVNKDFVYATSTDLSTVGGSETLWVYRADATSGTLAQIQQLSMPLNSVLYTEPTGHNLYELKSPQLLTLATLAVNSDGTVTDTGSSVTLPGPVNSVAVSPDGTRMYATVITGSASPGCNKGPCPTTDVIWEIDRDPATGTLALNHAVSGTENLHLGKLRFDASGSYLLGQSSSKQISVESVNHTTGDLTSVPGSPFTTTSAPSGDYLSAFEIDPSGKFVYAVNSGDLRSNSKYISVFSLSQATGALTPVQTLDMTPSNDVTGFIVDQSLVFVVNWPSSGSGVSFVPANISIFKRDPVTGFVSAGGSPVVMQDQERLQNAAIMHYQ